MEVILLEKVRNLGDLGEKVSVKPGYGFNYLIPQKMAVPANKGNIAEFERRRAELEQKANDVLVHAQQRAEKLNALTVTITAMASDEGKLYGSVGARDICDAVIAAGQELEKKEVLLPEGPIHEVGESNIGLQLHTDVTVSVKVVVVAAE